MNDGYFPRFDHVNSSELRIPPAVSNRISGTFAENCRLRDISKRIAPRQSQIKVFFLHTMSLVQALSLSIVDNKISKGYRTAPAILPASSDLETIF
jgi:hypothetical protein